MNVNTGGVLVVPAEMAVEQYLEMKRAEGDMIDVTPLPVPSPYPGHAPLGPVEPDPADDQQFDKGTGIGIDDVAAPRRHQCARMGRR